MNTRNSFPNKQEKTVLAEPLPVRAACHVRINLDIASPPGATLMVKQLCANELLARELRPLGAGDRHLDIKTHPAASHIACALLVDGQPANYSQFHVDCERSIDPVARHFIVIGAMKAGTTTLFHLLAQHPALCRTWAELTNISFSKEINYFCSLYQAGDTPLHYDWRFPFDAAKHAWTLDVSPNYAKWPGSRAAPARIASLPGKIKLAYIMRDPVDRIESHLAHALRRGGDVSALERFVRVSRYAMQLDKFAEHFPVQDILLLDFELLRKNPAALLAQVCGFLDIDGFTASSVVHNRRNIDFRLNATQRTELVETLRPDTERLIRDYGFDPAKKWTRQKSFRWLHQLVFRR